MTLGERIQQARKDKNLSQEALGDALGVSRQAVSKWESDITIPEIDKLIAMSRLFGVSVGALLGVETDDPAAPAAEELTDRELKAIETIVERYLEKSKKADKPRFKLWPVLVAGIAILVVVFWAKGQLDSLNSRMANLQSDVNSISGRVSAEINSMTNRIQEALEWEASLLTGHDVTVTGLDISGETLTVDIQATPKEYIEGMEVLFTAEPDGAEPLTIPGELISGHTFRVTGWTLPLNDSIHLSVSFGADGQWQTQALDGLYGYESGTRLGLELSRGGQSRLLSANNSATYSWYIDWTLQGIFYCKSEVTLEQGLTVESARFVVYRNEQVVTDTELKLTARGDSNWRFELAPECETPVTAGDALTYCIEYTDSLDRKYSYYLEGVEFEAGQNGGLDHTYTAMAVPDGAPEPIIDLDPS